MTLKDALSLLRRKGYCLWIGSGVTKHLSSIHESQTPSWHELVKEMESAAELNIVESINTFPERLELVLQKLGREAFQQRLNELIVLRIANNVTAATEGQSDSFAAPLAARQIARLGIKANSIVNFNIETNTSLLLASSGPFKIKSFEPPIDDEATGMHIESSGSNGDQYQRSVYHPHGALDAHGLCVLTKKDYELMKGTLAFQLAVHAAFRENLAIVGMSLEDEYLRDQITQFRNHINKIIWLVSHDPPPNLIEWLEINQVTLIKLSRWDEFWAGIDQHFPDITDEVELLKCWWLIFNTAFHTSIGFSLTDALIKAQRKVGNNVEIWQRLKKNRGEPSNEATALSKVDAERLEAITNRFTQKFTQLINNKEESK